MRIARHKELVDVWVQMIRAGQYLPGHRLPTHRAFAAQHSVALATATKVYAELEQMGLVVGEVGRGTFVREWKQEYSHPLDALTTDVHNTGHRIDLSFSYPTTPQAGEMLRQAMLDLMAQPNPDRLMLHQPVAGNPMAREALRRYLERRAFKVPTEQILLTTGAQQGLACSVMALFQPGDVVAVDALTYPGFTGLAQHQALELQAVPWLGTGPDLDALEALLKRRPIKAIFCMPTLHNPTGWVMDVPSRLRLVALAEQHNVWIIEDASYAFLAESAPPPLVQMAPHRTVYVSSLSKSVGGGLRLGYLVVPLVLIQRCVRVLRSIAWSQPTLPALLAAHWLDDGTVERLEGEKRRAARAKQKLAAKCLTGLELHAHPDSFFVWVKLPETVRAEPVTVRLAEQGIDVSPSSAFAVGSHYPHAIRLNLGAHSLKELKPALQTILRTIEDVELA
jgi:DNA-binding transcriptional MocR family regulator